MIDSQTRISQLVAHMIGDIETFESGRLSIDRLSASLKGQLAALNQAGADPAWVDELRALRNQVECVNAFFLNSGRAALTSEEFDEAHQALGELRQALTEYS